jgi:AraC-like DNA-binding protein
LFGSNLIFSAPVNALTFRRRDGELPVATFDASLQKIHNDYLKRQRNELASDGVTTRVKRTVLQHLHQGKPLIVEEVARSMNLSAHQLTRSLDVEGGGFQKLVDSVRLQHSHHLLLNTGLSLKKISYELGFKSQSALNKACERWFGMSPGRYRLSGKSSLSPAID